MTSKIAWLRLTAFLEGVCFLVLLGIAMPLKYVWGMPEWVRAVGMAHGWLSFRKTALALVASVVPFGTFWADVKLFRN
jgi:hypothetical protein